MKNQHRKIIFKNKTKVLQLEKWLKIDNSAEETDVCFDQRLNRKPSSMKPLPLIQLRLQKKHQETIDLLALIRERLEITR